ncbi:MAG: hypothetical protein ACYCW6_15450, partial [Candidatus Xenobia bacterium]
YDGVVQTTLVAQDEPVVFVEYVFDEAADVVFQVDPHLLPVWEGGLTAGTQEVSHHDNRLEVCDTRNGWFLVAGPEHVSVEAKGRARFKLAAS